MDKETKDLIEKILHEIAEDVILRYDKNELKNDIGLLSGKTGISLFMFYNSRYFKNERYKRYAQRILEDVFNDINKGAYIPTYCSGIAGVCWTIIHLVEEEFIASENIEVLNDIDPYLGKAMEIYVENNDFDFLHGATGIAFYFIKRANNSPKVKEYLKEYVRGLFCFIDIDEKTDTAKIMSTIINENGFRDYVYNLSLSHGMSSIVVVLCHILDKISDCEGVLEIIQWFSNYFLIQKNPEKTINHSLYPNAVPKDGILYNNSRISRLGWCYGDIGNGIALLKSAKYVKDKYEIYIKESNEIFQNLYLRKDLKIQSINDTEICHGTSGLICIMQSLKDIYGYNTFEELENYWLNITLDFYRKNDGIKGFSKFLNNKFIYDISLLCGTAGVALTLLNCIDSEKSNWTELLLLL